MPKPIRISPWLIVILAAVLVVAAGCNRPDPRVAIDTTAAAECPAQELAGRLFQVPLRRPACATNWLGRLFQCRYADPASALGSSYR
jgi:hypothetical protein